MIKFLKKLLSKEPTGKPLTQAQMIKLRKLEDALKGGSVNKEKLHRYKQAMQELESDGYDIKVPQAIYRAYAEKLQR